MAVTTLGSPSFNPIPLGSSSAPTSGQSIKVVGGGQMTAMVGETDPIFSAWDKSTGIYIYSSQILADAADIVPTGLICIEDDLEQAEGSGQSAYVILDWDDISTDTFDYYNVRYKKSTDTYYSYVTSKVSTIRIGGLLPNTIYNFGVASVNTQGTSSAFCTNLNVTTNLDNVAPATVTGLTALAGIQLVYLSWNKNSELDLNSYVIYRNTINDSGTAEEINECYSNRYTDYGLTADEIKYYWIKAKDTSGNESASFSSVASATPRNVSTADIVANAITAQLTNLIAINPSDGTINPSTVGSLQLDEGAVLEAHIFNGAVTAAKLSVAAIGATGDIKASAVGTAQIATNAVIESKILNDAISRNKLAYAAVGTDEIEVGSIITNHIGANQIVATHILAGAITANKLTAYNFIVDAASDAFTGNSVDTIYWTGCTVYYEGVENGYPITNGSTTDYWVYWEYESGTFSTSATLPVLGNDDFLVAWNDEGVPKLVWNATSVNGNRITAGTISASHIAAGAITAEKIEFGTITGDKIAAGSITANKIVSYNFQVVGKILTGSINPTASTTVNGSGTLFLTEVSAGDHIVVSGEVRKVDSVSSDILLYVETAFSDNDNDTSPYVITDTVFQNNTPNSGEVSWPNCKVVYNGVEYDVVADSCASTDVYIYWQPSLPGVFGMSDTIPLTTNGYFLVGTNGNTYYDPGIFVYAWNNTTIDGNRITTGSIYANLIAAGAIEANHIGADQITAIHILAGEINADHIATGTITTNELNFTPVKSDNVVASINASAEGVKITGARLEISGDCFFYPGYNPSGKTGTFKQGGIPTSLAIGDLWIDTNDNNKLYRADCIGANEITVGEWELVRDRSITELLEDLTYLNDDDYLSRSEKPRVVADYNAILDEQSYLDDEATAFEVVAEKTAYDASITALTSYLTGLTPAYNNYDLDTDLGTGGGIILRGKFTDVYEDRAALREALTNSAGNWFDTKISGGYVTSGTFQVGSGLYTNAGITGNGASGDSIRIWAGATEGNKTSAPFRVDDDGNLVANSGVIGGWSIDDEYIWSGTKLETDNYTAAPGDITLNANDGSIHANSFYINGDGECSFTATSGSIAGISLKTINIGVWNMNSTASVEIDPTVVPANIRGLIVEILSDSDTTPAYKKYPLEYDDQMTGPSGRWSWGTGTDSSKIVLNRRGSGFFTSTDFNGSENRGYITILYSV